MDGVLEQIEQAKDQVRKAQRQLERDASRREAVVAACETVAGWGPGCVVGLASPAVEEDMVMQLAWAIIDLAAAVSRSGMAARLAELAVEHGEPARSYALGLVVLACKEGVREELDRRVDAAWSRPEVWRDVAAWIRRLPDLLLPIGQPTITMVSDAIRPEPRSVATAAETPKQGPAAEAGTASAGQVPVPPEALSKEDAARFLGVGVPAIENLIRTRKIQYVQLGSQRGRVIPVEALRKLLKDNLQLTGEELQKRRGRR